MAKSEGLVSVHKVMARLEAAYKDVEKLAASGQKLVMEWAHGEFHPHEQRVLSAADMHAGLASQDQAANAAGESAAIAKDDSKAGSAKAG